MNGALQRALQAVGVRARHLSDLVAPRRTRIRGRVVSVDSVWSPISGLGAAAIHHTFTAVAEEVIQSTRVGPIRLEDHRVLEEAWTGERLHLLCDGRMVVVPLAGAKVKRRSSDPGLLLSEAPPPELARVLASSAPGAVYHDEWLIQDGDLVELVATVRPSSPEGGPFRGRAPSGLVADPDAEPIVLRELPSFAS